MGAGAVVVGAGAVVVGAGAVVEAAGTVVEAVGTGAAGSATWSATVVGVEARSSTRILAPSGKTCRSTSSTAVFAT